MARSVLRLSRRDKHQRLFELIRQDNLALRQRARSKAEQAHPRLQALRDKAQQSLKP